MPANKQVAHVRRIKALMAVLGYDRRGGQTAFAEEIGIDPDTFSAVMTGGELSKKVAFAIFRRFRVVSLEFLWFGLPGLPLDQRVQEELLQWERRTGEQIF